MASSIHRGSKQTHLSKKKTADTKRQKKGYEAEGETLVDLQGISWDSRQEKKEREDTSGTLTRDKRHEFSIKDRLCGKTLTKMMTFAAISKEQILRDKVSLYTLRGIQGVYQLLLWLLLYQGSRFMFSSYGFWGGLRRFHCSFKSMHAHSVTYRTRAIYR